MLQVRSRRGYAGLLQDRRTFVNQNLALVIEDGLVRLKRVIGDRVAHHRELERGDVKRSKTVLFQKSKCLVGAHQKLTLAGLLLTTHDL